VDPDEARAKAASALSETAQQMERAAKAREEQLDALREELKGVDGGEGAPESSPLAKALSRGDFEEAQRLIEQHRQSLDQLEQQERDRIAQELRQAAQGIGEQSETPVDQPPSPSEESLRDLGVDEQTIDELQNEID